MLTNDDIEKICKKYKLPLVGVFSKDELKKIPPCVGSYYINLQDSNEGDGTHWCYMRIYSDTDYEKNNICNAIYFDSFGFGQPKAVSKFLEPFKPVYCNNREIQYINDSHCGWYCIYLDYMLTHCKDGTTEETFSKFLNSWDNNVKNNKNLLIKRLKKIDSYFLHL
jgi:hypothetical protein